MDALAQQLVSNAWTILIVLFLLGFFVQWMAWVFGWGRFSGSRVPEDSDERRPLRFVITEFLTNVINDFRHLLALIVILMFAATLVYVLWRAGNNVDNINKALQAVTGTLSGIIGVILGYYFGESAARERRDGGSSQSQAGGEAVQQQPAGGAGAIDAAPPPPPLDGNGQ